MLVPKWNPSIDRRPQISTSIKHPTSDTKNTYEEIQGTINYVLADQLNPNSHHIDLIFTSIYHRKDRLTFL